MEVKCPKCGCNRFTFCELVWEMRDTRLDVDEDGDPVLVIFGDSSYEDSDGTCQLTCNNIKCGHEFAIPEGLDIDFE